MAPTASATGTITVDNTAGSGCSDGSAVFCHIEPAIAAAGVNGTVNVAAGLYVGPINVTVPGVTLLGNHQAVIGGGTAGFAIDVNDVTVDGFTVQGTSGAGFLLGDHHNVPTPVVANNLTIKNNAVANAGGVGFDSDNVTNSTFSGNSADHNGNHGFYFTAGSDGNKILNNEASFNSNQASRSAAGISILTKSNLVDGNNIHDNQDSGLQFYAGGDNNVATNNVVYNNGDHGIDNLNTVGGYLLNNTAYNNCTAGINVEGLSSTGYTVENNIAMNNGTNTLCLHGPVGADHKGKAGQVRVADGAIGKTVENYNVIYSANNVLDPIDANKQARGVNDKIADPGFTNVALGEFTITGGSPAVAASDPAVVPYAPSLDIDGLNRPAPPASAGASEGNPNTTEPIARAIITGPNPGYAPSDVGIDASKSFLGTATGLTYAIDYDSATPGGAGNTSTSPTSTHQYTKPGKYVISVTIADAGNPARTSTKKYTITVTAKPATPVLSVTPSSGQSPLTVTASGAGTTKGGSAITSYLFDFGDGSATAQVSVPAGGAWPTHTYTTSGTFNVTMTVLDAAGVSSATATQQITTTSNITVNQIGGTDRYATGLLVSQHRWQNGQAKAVVLATGRNFADALAGVPLATKVGGPLLLVDGTAGTVDPTVIAEINRVLQPGGQIYILGGGAAVSQGIESQLKLGHSVTRYQGANRYQTSVDIAVRGLGSPQHTVVATGNGFADALASGPFATGPFADAPGAPAAILLSNDKVLDPYVSGYLAGKDNGYVATIGHQAAAAVPGAAQSYAGNDRFDTDQQVAAAFSGAATGNQVGVADGMNFPDALTGGAYMASLATPGPVVLVDGINKVVPGQAATVLDGRRTNTEADIFGGQTVVTGAMSGAVVAHLAASTLNHIGF
jgi:parallel beta-helix repeat protein